MSTPDSSVTFKVTCLPSVDQCEVAFEPEGAVVTIRAGESITVEMRGPGSGVPEVCHNPRGITVYPWNGADTFAWDESGKQLQL
jgi:hypothetical protein